MIPIPTSPTVVIPTRVGLVSPRSTNSLSAYKDCLISTTKFRLVLSANCLFIATCLFWSVERTEYQVVVAVPAFWFPKYLIRVFASTNWTTEECPFRIKFHSDVFGFQLPFRDINAFCGPAFPIPRFPNCAVLFTLDKVELPTLRYTLGFGFVVPMPNESVEGFHTNKLSVLTVVSPEVTSTKGIYLRVLVESKETLRLDADPIIVPTKLLA